MSKEESYVMRLKHLAGKRASGEGCNYDADCELSACDTAGVYGCKNKCMVPERDTNRDADFNCPLSRSLVVESYLSTCAVGEWTGCTCSFGTTLVPPNSWSHVAVTYDGTHHSIYVNSVFSEKATCANGGVLSKNDADLRLGATGGDTPGTGSENLDGRIDEAALFNRALSSEELVTVMNIPQPACEFHPPGSIVGVAAGDGSSEQSPARDCAVLLLRGIVASGVYWIQPDKGVAPFRVYCDQQKHGGGWTLVYKIAGASKMKDTNEVDSELALLENNIAAESSGKLSDTIATSLCTSQYRMVQADRQGNPLTGASDLFCRFDDITRFGDDSASAKRCSTGYSSNPASYSTAYGNLEWGRGFSAWGSSNGGIVAQLMYNPGELPTPGSGSGTGSGSTQPSLKSYFQRQYVESTTNGWTQRILDFNKKRSDTVLRFHWSDNVRCHGADGVCCSTATTVTTRAAYTTRSGMDTTAAPTLTTPRHCLASANLRVNTGA